MTYLKTPSELAVAIGANVGGNAPIANDPKFIAMLDACHSKLEDLLSTRIGHAMCTDHYDLSSRYSRNISTLCTTDGFLVAGTVVVKDPNGEPLNSDDLFINHELGVIKVDRSMFGRYTVEYEAGFKSDMNSKPPVYIDTPAWLRSLLDPTAVLWARTVTMSTKTPENVSFSALLTPLYREIAGRVYGRYQRPRVQVHQPFHNVRIPIVEGS